MYEVRRAKKSAKILSWFIIFVMLIITFGGNSVFADTVSVSSEDGTEIPDYIDRATIGNVEYLLFDSGEDMAWLRQHVLNGGDSGESGSHTPESTFCTHNIMLTADIDMTEYNGLDSQGGTLHEPGYNNGMYSGIGVPQNGCGYSGIFDGNGHTIANLNVFNNEGVGPKALLFNLTKDATVKNIVVKGDVISNRYMGGLIGRATGSLTLDNVVVNANVSLSDEGNANAVGGLIGQLGAGQTYSTGTVTINNCVAVGKYVSSTPSNPVGGLIGHIYGGFDAVNISNSYAAADLEAVLTAGVIGSNGSGKLSVKNCYYLDSMADTPLMVMEGSTADPSPVTPESGFINVSSLSEAAMKAPLFINRLGQGNFKADDQSAANGYPIPVTIGSYDTKFIWSGSPALEYNIGSKFNLEGLTILASSENGSIDVTDHAEISKTDDLTLEDDGITITVTITYGGNVEMREYTIAVKDMRDFNVNWDQVKTEYYEGEKFDPTGMVVTGKFGENEEEIEITTYSYAPYSVLKADDSKITISYLGATREIPITVHPRYLSKIEVTAPNNLIYAADESVDVHNLVVSAYYQHAPETPVPLPIAAEGNDGYTCTIDKTSGTVSVSYTEKGTTCTDSFGVSFLKSNAPAITDGVYQISNADHLVWFANRVNALGKSNDAVLLNDIDLSDSILFNSIGNNDIPYSGDFNGNNHTVTLSINSELNLQYVGFFGRIANSHISNLKVSGNIISSAEGSQYVGGIVGFVDDSCIDNCISDVDISLDGKYVGGIAGWTRATSGAGITMSIQNCINSGNISATGECAGGIVGSMQENFVTEIFNCINYGDISGGNNTAGIVGVTAGSVRNCQNSGSIVSVGSSVGGIIGAKNSLSVQNTESIIENVYNTGNITADSNLGGIIGSMYTGGMSFSYSGGHVMVQNVYNTGNVVASGDNAGGIIGWNHTEGGSSKIRPVKNVLVEIKNVYNRGHVTAGSFVGGIIGRDNINSNSKNVSDSHHTVSNVYNTGNMNLSDTDGKAGAIVGGCFKSDGSSLFIDINDAYYLSVNENTVAYNLDAGTVVSETNIDAKTEAEFKDQQSDILTLLGDAFTFIHSDVINDGYPVLVWQSQNVADEEHVWDEGVVTKEPTRTETGEKEYTCEICGATKVEILDKLPSSSGGSGGGGSAVDTTERNVTVSESANGKVAVSPEKAKSGSTVTVTVTPDEGYKLDKLAVTDASGKTITVTAKDGKYTFTMPASAVSVKASFAKDDAQTQPGDGKEMKFTDVSANDWFHDDVKYVFDRGMMNGTSDTLFSPSVDTTRAMIVTILYRLEESPAAGNAEFSDVVSGAYYDNAVAWAAANDIVKGYEDGTFKPDKAITREEMAAILYRYAAYKKYDTAAIADLSKFSDKDQISSYAVTAMKWANGEGLINGVGNNLIDAKGSAVRSQAAAILARFCKNIAEM